MPSCFQASLSADLPVGHVILTIFQKQSTIYIVIQCLQSYVYLRSFLFTCSSAAYGEFFPRFIESSRYFTSLRFFPILSSPSFPFCALSYFDWANSAEYTSLIDKSVFRSSTMPLLISLWRVLTLIPSSSAIFTFDIPILRNASIFPLSINFKCCPFLLFVVYYS